MNFQHNQTFVRDQSCVFTNAWKNYLSCIVVQHLQVLIEETMLVSIFKTMKQDNPLLEKYDVKSFSN